MKEIDFLPEWYKSGRRRRMGYRTQYIALGGVLIVMMVWNFTTARSISKAKAELAHVAAGQAQAEKASQEFAALKTEIADLQKKAQSIDQIDSNIDVASVLAEMSYLIDKKIVLGKMEFIAEKFADKQGAQTNNNVVRMVIPALNEKRTLHLGDVRFKIVIRGIAADAGDVAALICKLEDSPYFCQVVPSFSRNAEVKVADYSSLPSGTDTGERTAGAERDIQQSGRSIQVSEFEISCYLANYIEK
jgi:Tfp pilus assembly protein PilN